MEESRMTCLCMNSSDFVLAKTDTFLILVIITAVFWQAVGSKQGAQVSSCGGWGSSGNSICSPPLGVSMHQQLLGTCDIAKDPGQSR